MNSAFAVLLFVLYSILPILPEQRTRQSPKRIQQADFTQSQRMLDLLDSVSRGPVPPEKVESVLNAYGTGLIIRQQNISRSVVKDQYKVLLQSLAEKEAPSILLVDSSERAKRGVEGLYKDVWPELIWAIAHRELLKVSEQIVRSVLEENLQGEEYEKAIAPMLGTGWHSAGAVMLNLIDQTGGLKQVMEVLRDPRKLLIKYNEAILKSRSSRKSSWLFDRELTRKVSYLGR